PPSRTWVLDVGMQVATALVDVHRSGIIHRDINPSNIFLAEANAIPLLVKLIDFGLSHSPQFATDLQTDSKGIAGTLKYLAPEVIEMNDPTTAADIYSFGVSLYELATGRFPYEFSSIDELVAVHRQAPTVTFPHDSFPFPETFASLVTRMLS